MIKTTHLSDEPKVMIPFALFLKLICFGECTGITFIDLLKWLSAQTNVSNATEWAKVLHGRTAGVHTAVFKVQSGSGSPCRHVRSRTEAVL